MRTILAVAMVLMASLTMLPGANAEVTCFTEGIGHGPLGGTSGSGSSTKIVVGICDGQGNTVESVEVPCGTVCEGTPLVCTHPEVDNYGRARVAVGYYYGTQATPIDCSGAQFVVYSPWTPRLL